MVKGKNEIYGSDELEQQKILPISVPHWNQMVYWVYYLDKNFDWGK